MKARGKSSFKTGFSTVIAGSRKEMNMNRLILLVFVVLVLVLVGSGCGSESQGDTWTRPADEMVMVYVPEGEFEMGSNEEFPPFLHGKGIIGKPAHSVALDGFWIDRTEVSNAQYRRCVEAVECEAPGFMCMEFKDEAKTNHPLPCASWLQAEAYCAWAGGRLPTEAEWEYAARGPENFIYPWGDDEPNATLLNYDDNVGDTTEVGSYPEGASWCGVLDMAGNVAEWVADWYAEEYATSPSRNPTGPTYGEQRVARGGAWITDSMAALFNVRSDYRAAAEPSATGSSRGFRCAKDAE